MKTKITTEDTSKVKYGIGKRQFFGQGAIMLLVLAVIFRIIGFWGQWKDGVYFIMNFAVPAVACLLYALCIYLFGKKGFFLSFLPVVIGAAFFIYKSLGIGNVVYTVLLILLCVVTAVVYACTMFGAIHTKWLLPPLFILPFVFRIIKDLPALSDTVNPVSFSAGMQEMSTLCILLGMFFAAMGIRKRRPPEIPVVEGEEVAAEFKTEEPLPAAETLPAVCEQTAAPVEDTCRDEHETVQEEAEEITAGQADVSAPEADAQETVNEE